MQPQTRAQTPPVNQQRATKAKNINLRLHLLMNMKTMQKVFSMELLISGISNYWIHSRNSWLIELRPLLPVPVDGFQWVKGLAIMSNHFILPMSMGCKIPWMEVTHFMGNPQKIRKWDKDIQNQVNVLPWKEYKIINNKIWKISSKLNRMQYKIKVVI